MDQNNYVAPNGDGTFTVVVNGRQVPGYHANQQAAENAFNMAQSQFQGGSAGSVSAQSPGSGWGIPPGAGYLDREMQARIAQNQYNLGMGELAGFLPPEVADALGLPRGTPSLQGRQHQLSQQYQLGNQFGYAYNPTTGQYDRTTPTITGRQQYLNEANAIGRMINPVTGEITNAPTITGRQQAVTEANLAGYLINPATGEITQSPTFAREQAERGNLERLAELTGEVPPELSRFGYGASAPNFTPGSSPDVRIPPMPPNEEEPRLNYYGALTGAPGGRQGGSPPPGSQRSAQPYFQDDGGPPPYERDPGSTPPRQTLQARLGLGQLGVAQGALAGYVYDPNTGQYTQQQTLSGELGRRQADLGEREQGFKEQMERSRLAANPRDYVQNLFMQRGEVPPGGGPAGAGAMDPPFLRALRGERGLPAYGGETPNPPLDWMQRTTDTAMSPQLSEGGGVMRAAVMPLDYRPEGQPPNLAGIQQAQATVESGPAMQTMRAWQSRLSAASPAERAALMPQYQAAQAAFQNSPEVRAYQDRARTVEGRGPNLPGSEGGLRGGIMPQQPPSQQAPTTNPLVAMANRLRATANQAMPVLQAQAQRQAGQVGGLANYHTLPGGQRGPGFPQSPPRANVPQAHQLNARSYLNMNPSERQVFGSLVSSTGQDPEDYAERFQRSLPKTNLRSQMARWTG